MEQAFLRHYRPVLDVSGVQTRYSKRQRAVSFLIEPLNSEGVYSFVYTVKHPNDVFDKKVAMSELVAKKEDNPLSSPFLHTVFTHQNLSLTAVQNCAMGIANTIRAIDGMIKDSWVDTDRVTRFLDKRDELENVGQALLEISAYNHQHALTNRQKDYALKDFGFFRTLFGDC